MLFKLTRQNQAFYNDNSYHTRKNFPDTQKLSGYQCYPATGVFGPLQTLILWSDMRCFASIAIKFLTNIILIYHVPCVWCLRFKFKWYLWNITSIKNLCPDISSGCIWVKAYMKQIHIETTPLICPLAGFNILKCFSCTFCLINILTLYSIWK